MGLIKSCPGPLALYVTMDETEEKRNRLNWVFIIILPVEMVRHTNIFRSWNSSGNYVPAFKCIGHIDRATGWRQASYQDEKEQVLEIYLVPEPDPLTMSAL